MSFRVPTPVRRQKLVSRLRDERLAQGKSLDALAEETRIRAPLLADLEELREDRLPNAIVTKGYAVAYARAVGLAVDEVRRVWGRPRERVVREPRRRLTQRWPLVALVVAIVLGALLAWAYAERISTDGGGSGILHARAIPSSA